MSFVKTDLNLNDTFLNHKQVVAGINQESYDLYKKICLLYQEFCNFIRDCGIAPDYLYVSSYGFRRLKTDNNTGAHYLGLAVDITYNGSNNSMKQLCLFGFFLQKRLDNHVALSLHNRHIHVDILKDRYGMKSVEFEKDTGGYYFKNISQFKTDVYKKYNLNDSDIALIDKLPSSKGISGILLAILAIIGVAVGVVIAGGR